MDASRISIKKEEYTPSDLAKKDYYRKIEELRSRALTSFNKKSRKMAIECLNRIIKLALTVHDFIVLKRVHNLLGTVAIFFKDYQTAMTNYKYLV
jgi:hypothetical protein